MRLRSSTGEYSGNSPPEGNNYQLEGVLVGERMINAGQISREDFSEILAYQRVNGTHFADAAVALGKLDATEAKTVVAQHSLTSALLTAGDERVSPLVRAAFVAEARYVEQVRAIRSRIIAQPRGNGASNRAIKVALIGIAAGDEASVLCANLAVVFAQLGSRTLLVDCGMGDPVIDSLFRVPGEQGLAQALQAPQASAVVHQTAFLLLAVVPAGNGSATAQAYLHKQALAKVIDRWSRPADYVLANMPSMETGALSLGTILAGFDGAVLVTRKDITRVADVRNVIDGLDAQDIPVLGSVIA